MPEAVRFLEPVDWEKLKLPLYPNIIENPLDLGTISRKLNNLEYSNIFEFDKDMNLVWSNAKKMQSARIYNFQVSYVFRENLESNFCGNKH